MYWVIKTWINEMNDNNITGDRREKLEILHFKVLILCVKQYNII